MESDDRDVTYKWWSDGGQYPEQLKMTVKLTTAKEVNIF
jgi:hypothetical protein